MAFSVNLASCNRFGNINIQLQGMKHMHYKDYVNYDQLEGPLPIHNDNVHKPAVYCY